MTVQSTFFALVAASLAVSGFRVECRAQTLHEIIDREIEQSAAESFSLPADDAEFLRRISLDFAGMPPSAAEAREFLADQDPAKREKLLNCLLDSEAWPRRMQEVMTSMLLERRSDTNISDREWEKYLRESFAANKPWDKLVSELLFSEPSENSAPPNAKFFLVTGRNDPQLITADVARIFLGRDIACAQCHDHPTVPDFTQADYFGLFTFLQETPDKGRTEFESVFLPGKKTTGPRLPGGPEVQIPSFEKSQAEEAKKYRPRLLLSAELPRAGDELFVRNSVNRFWFLLMGRGLVHPLQLHHSGNPPSHPALLMALADDFVQHEFDVKYLLREIALSRAYQRSSQLPTGLQPEDVPPESFRTAIQKPLLPEQMAWSVMQSTGVLAALLAAPVPEKSEFLYNNYINGRIENAPDNFPDAMALFVGVFANPPGEAEVEFSTSMGHALFLMNERLILNWLQPTPGTLVERVAKLTDQEQIAEELYLSILTRMPTAEEQGEVTMHLGQFPNRRVESIGELAWALLASAEFRVNH